jgi:hypothetical protein
MKSAPVTSMDTIFQLIALAIVAKKKKKARKLSCIN